MKMSKSRLFNYLMALVLAVSLSGCVFKSGDKPGKAGGKTGNNQNIILATTTSTQDSGLLDVLIPVFQDKTGYVVKTIAVGSGQALAMGERGEADVLLVHAPDAEIKLVESGAAINRQLVMHNDFILVGPAGDPAGVKGIKTASEAFAKISQAQALFISRGDDSGTDKKEKGIWKKTGIEPGGQWYQETGSGMGQTLNITSEKQGYTLTDRATYLSMKDTLKLEIIIQGEPGLLNIYHVMQVNQEIFPKVNSAGAAAMVDFFINPETQDTIGKFGVGQFGQALFFPDAGKSEEDL
ncbi:MAG: ABC transporter substrate-binding protein [Bacillota bacterium]